MRAREINFLAPLTILVMAIIGLLSLNGTDCPDVTRFAVWAAVVVAAGLMGRTAFAAFCMRMADKEKEKETAEEEENPDELTEIAVCMHRKKEVAENYLAMIQTKEGRRIQGAQAILAKITDAYDGDGNVAGYWYLYVGTRRAFHQFEKELTNATVLDWWPLELAVEEAAERLMEEYEDEEEKTDDGTEPDAEDLPGDGDGLHL